ncbi:DUF4258 domain-containing protein [Acidobacteria bacterium AH-259-G07]|nr:DUF4258 domain-containing protein [Acidobacteria bacterium AH-259-G07]
MSQRNIRRDDINLAIKGGKIIKRYESDKPFRSYLITGTSGERMLHVLVGWDDSTEMAYMITVYEPDQ